MSSIYLPVEIKFGLGSSSGVGKSFNSLKCKKVMIITDQGVENAGVLKGICESLNKFKISYVVFNKVIPDPNVESVNSAKNFYIEEGCDGILAIGGGSSIDTAKGAGILITNKGSLMDLSGMDKINNPLPPIIVIPTTCGTGSEVTNVTVITDDNHFKTPFVSRKLIPKVAFLDPKLLKSLPSHIVASTGMDALTHAVEALTNKNDNWYADACSLRAIRIIGENIKLATDQRDITSLSNMLYASTLAGVSFTLSRLGLVHAMSHPISGFGRVAHGLANAILLPYVLKYNLEANPEKHALFSKKLGVANQGSIIETAKAGVEKVIKINNQLGIPNSFKELGLNKTLIPNMVEDTFKSSNVSINARTVTKSDVEKIYLSAFS